MAALIATVDVDVTDIAAITDVTAERQVGLVGVAIAKPAIGADAVWAVAVRRHSAAAREATNAHSVPRRRRLRDAQHSTMRVGTEDGAENAADAGSIIQAILHRGRTLLRGHVRVHRRRVAVRSVLIVGIWIRLISIILRSRRSRSRKGRKACRTGENFGHRTHGELPPLNNRAFDE